MTVAELRKLTFELMQQGHSAKEVVFQVGEDGSGSRQQWTPIHFNDTLDDGGIFIGLKKRGA